MSLLEIHEPGETPLPHAGEASLAVGIDLGTTNSVVAIAREGVPAALHDETGKALVPSIVAYPDAGGVLVGEEARLLMAREPRNAVASIKRLMGRGAADLHTVAGVLPYEIEPGSGQTDMVKLRIGGKARSPVEISAEILKSLRARAEAALDKPVERAVITVPAYFDDAARTATRDAARVAGLEVLRLVNEPTAAALAYGLDKGSEGLYAVYDLGGGTFDFSLLRLEKGVFQVLATGGDAALTEQTVGAGRLLVFASDLDNQWSRFPLHPSFVPFAVETARYLTQGRQQGRDFTLPDVPAGVPATPGVVRTGEGATARQMVVNVDVRESRPAATSVDEFMKDITRTNRSGDHEIVDVARDAEDRQRWWQVGLLVMLVALAGEALVGRRAA